MKQALISAVVAAGVALVALQIGGLAGDDDEIAERLANHEALVNKFKPTVLSFTMENIEDSIVNGARYSGGPSDKAGLVARGFPGSRCNEKNQGQGSCFAGGCCSR